MQLLVIYNPKAGTGRSKMLLPEVASYLEKKQLEADIQLTTHKGHATKLVCEADFSQYDAIISSGGDGTQFEVLNGYYQNTSNNKPPMGLIPNGTGNAFMKELGLKKADWKEAVDIIALNKPRLLDVGRFRTGGRTFYFVGMGFISQVAQAAIPLKWMGNGSYTAATLLKLMGLKSTKIQIKLDGRMIERDNVFAEVANSTYTGTSFFIAPKAKLDDGLLDLVLLNKISRFRLLRVYVTEVILIILKWSIFKLKRWK